MTSASALPRQPTSLRRVAVLVSKFPPPRSVRAFRPHALAGNRQWHFGTSATRHSATQLPGASKAHTLLQQPKGSATRARSRSGARSSCAHARAPSASASRRTLAAPALASQHRRFRPRVPTASASPSRSPLAFATVTSALRRSSNFPRRSLVAIILALHLSTGVPHCVGATFSTLHTLPLCS